MWGEIQFCWNYIDEVIDFILSTGSEAVAGIRPYAVAAGKKTDLGKNDASGAKQLSAEIWLSGAC